MRSADASLSVVVAVWGEEAALEAGLASLDRQRDGATEILAVANIDRPSGLEIRYPWLRWERMPDDCLIPQLWSRGIDLSRGEVIATTTACFEPAEDWLERLCEAHRRLDSAGIGGSILAPAEASGEEWATFFLRYGAYREDGEERQVEDLAADNASYRRSALEAHRDTWADGFWEPDLHRRLLAEGRTLTFVPGIRVTMRSGFGTRRFCAQRRDHGRQFGFSRLRARGRAMRLAAVIGAPLVPAILSAKVARRALTGGRHRLQFLRSLPWLLLFVVCWSVGEAEGSLRSLALALRRPASSSRG